MVERVLHEVLLELNDGALHPQQRITAMISIVTPHVMRQVGTEQYHIAVRKPLYAIAHKAAAATVPHIDYFVLAVEVPGISETVVVVVTRLYRVGFRYLELFVYYLSHNAACYQSGICRPVRRTKIRIIIISTPGRKKLQRGDNGNNKGEQRKYQ